jgi:hypothetical protein
MISDVFTPVCVTGFFLKDEGGRKTCIDVDGCQEGWYADSGTKTCKMCGPACKSCKTGADGNFCL